MLSAEHRMRTSAEFRATMQAGTRAGRRSVIVHVHPGEPDTEAPTRVGFVVSKQVGNAVVRNRVKRRLRHLIRPYLAEESSLAAIVIRALPLAATQPQRLAGDLADALERATRSR